MISPTQSLPAGGPQLNEQLAQLRDIRLPEEISWWPLAHGWWIVLGALALLACLTAAYLTLKRRTLRFAALQELKHLGLKADDMPISTLATDVGVLLRRVVLKRHQREHLASAHGDEWQTFLVTEPQGMKASIAHFIAIAPYAKHTHAQVETPTAEVLIDAAKTWIRRHA